MWLGTSSSCLQDFRTKLAVPPSFRLLGVVDSKMVSQASAVNLSAASPVVSPTARLVAGTSVVATFLRLSSIASHAILGLCTGAGEYVSFCLTVVKGSCG